MQILRALYRPLQEGDVPAYRFPFAKYVFLIDFKIFVKLVFFPYNFLAACESDSCIV